MNNHEPLLQQLFALRRKFRKVETAEKIKLLNSIHLASLKSKKAFQLYADILLFLIAYPDNKAVYTKANQLLQQLHAYLQTNEKRQYSLYNTGITGTAVCAAFGFEMVKWLRQQYPDNIRIVSFEADDAQLQSIICSLMSKLESEILQDSYFTWKEWIEQTLHPGETLLDGLIAIFDNNSTRPEVKDELWSAMGVNVEIIFTEHSVLSKSLTVPYYHRNLIRTQEETSIGVKSVKQKLTSTEAQQIVDCSRMILVRHLREIDPISFADIKLVSYYQLPRGFSIALLEMTAERRHPIDSYIGYTVFKNGLPVAYAGSWLLFDSARIGLNVFPSYRGGESQYIFQQVLDVHAQVYRLKRFTVDPYQIGNKNSDGIQSGAFWIYYRAGFRPVLPALAALANAEAEKIKTIPGYRSPAGILKKLAANKLELVLQKKAVCFDANDLSLAYASLLKNNYHSNRKKFEQNKAKQLAALLNIKNSEESTMNFMLQNWALLLMPHATALINNRALQQQLKQLLTLKATGSEAAYHQLLQKANELRDIMEKIVIN
ncbi:MAG: hypothetical protein K2X48_07810 [Chitinophagaceae bacterium]|nr:hypothetical protein [Chitinophagaceae bacterium]